jgi:LSD1 subclass zinc finger protein
MISTCEACDRPVPGGYLCPGCQDDFTDRLAALPTLYAALGAMLHPGRSTDGRGGTVVEAPAPARLDVIDARAEFGVLSSWARALAEDMRTPIPAMPDDLGARVTAACAALAAAREWIATSWPDAGPCATAVRVVYDDARSITGTENLPAKMGRCPTVVHGQACGAELLLPDGAQVLRCAWCGTTYPPGVWAALRVAQRTAAFSPSEAAAAAHPSRASASAGTR